ncbi:MAG: hypothetical protein ABSA75_10625 [Candidatus Bathyarchaeia archaeon]
METAVATLLLVTAAVMMACVVVDFAVNTMEQTLNTQNNPQLNQIKSIENNILNQTGIFNQTQTQPPSQTPP